MVIERFANLESSKKYEGKLTSFIDENVERISEMIG